jgi:hypothetical protein
VVGLGLALFAAAASLDSAEQEAGSQLGVHVHTFQDSRGVTVVSPSFDLSRDFTDRTALRARFGVDGISAASDSCVRCHKQGVTSARAVVGASLVRKLTNAKLSVGAEISQEHFYRSTTILSSASRTFNKANTTVAGGFSFSLNQPKLHPRDASRSQLTQNAFVSVTQTVTKTTAVQAGYELGHVGGYQNDPFLRARLNGELVLGNNPDSRTRHTFTLRVRQALPADSYVEGDYRYYRDDWALHSSSLSLGVSHQFSPRLLVKVGYRGYRQTGTSFYAPEYFESPEFFTSDFRLMPFGSRLFSGRTVLTPADGLWFFARGTSFVLEYQRYSSDTDFQAAIFSAGVRVPLDARGDSK